MIFKYDHILRNKEGVPLGRAVLRSDSDYEEGKSFSAALLKFPKVYSLQYNDLEVWIDGSRYRISTDKVKDRGEDHVISNTLVEYIGEEND